MLATLHINSQLTIAGRVANNWTEVSSLFAARPSQSRDSRLAQDRRHLHQTIQLFICKMQQVSRRLCERSRRQSFRIRGTQLTAGRAITASCSAHELIAYANCVDE